MVLPGLVVVVALAVVEAAEVVDMAEVLLEEEEPELPQAGLARTENWVEYWNSPVPSTMINMP
jgi:hypothetical protein